MTQKAEGDTTPSVNDGNNYNESAADRNKQQSSILQPGTTAPEFRLNVTPDQQLQLTELRGNPVIIAFYPADWSPVCGDQLALYNQVLPEFKRFDAELLGISVDGAWCHRAYSEHRNLHFPFLGEVVRAFPVRAASIQPL